MSIGTSDSTSPRNGHGASEPGVRTYRGRRLADLLPQIRAELGPDAIILREREGLVGGINGFFATRFVEVDARPGTPGLDIRDDDAALHQPDRAPDAVQPPRAGYGFTVSAAPPAVEAAEPAPPARRILPPPEASQPLPVPAAPAEPVTADAIDETPRSLAPEAFARMLEEAAEEEARAEAEARAAAEAKARAEKARAEAQARAEAKARAAAEARAAAAERVKSELPAVPAPAVPSAPVEATPSSAAPAPDATAAAPAARSRSTRRTRARATAGRTIDGTAAAPVAAALLDAGLSETWTQRLVVEAAAHGAPFAPDGDLRRAARTALSRQLAPAPALPAGGARVGFVGSAGAGKTRAAAALAAAYARASTLPVSFISIAGQEQARQARLLLKTSGVPVSAFADAVRAARAVAEASREGIVVVDTPALPGAAADDETAAAVTAQVCALELDHVYLTLPATLSTDALQTAIAAAAPTAPTAAAITRVDETHRLGVAVEALTGCALPVALLHGGLDLADALSAPSPSELAERLLP